MNLRALPTTPTFTTSTSGLLDLFLVPALSRSSSYDRGVGFFTSNWLRLAASGLSGLAGNGGRARIVASPKLSAEDVEALAKGMEARLDVVLHDALKRTFAELEADLSDQTLSALSWMVADGLLDFRIAIAVGRLDGDFHDKFGIFRDASGDAIAFRGSPNDSERAFRNYESISAYYSWLDDRERERVAAEQARFDLIWNNADPNLRVYEMPEAIKRDLIAFTSQSERPYRSSGSAKESDDKWRHQREAVAAFLAAKNGILEMATGTGKTRTAIAIIAELRERAMAASVIVTAYGTDLLDQWHGELLRRSKLAVYRAYDKHREAQSFINAPDGSVLLMSRQFLASVLPKIPAAVVAKSLLICDEVHGLGSPALVAALSGHLGAFPFRLGLSATPERVYDEAGNRFIEHEIGPVIFRFTLEQAIERGILCPFDYVPIEYEFSDDDRTAVRLAIRRHHGRARSGEAHPIEQLYQELARIRKLSVEKLPRFREYLKAHPQNLERCLIFVETAAYGERVQDILMEAGVNFNTYYQDDDRARLRAFAKGRLQCLVTCKRISEGIDIQSVNSIVLFASSRAKLETVQRLGRCLRSDPGDPRKRATVIDFIRTDDVDLHDPTGESTADVERREWFERLAALQSPAFMAEKMAMISADRSG